MAILLVLISSLSLHTFIRALLSHLLRGPTALLQEFFDLFIREVYPVAKGRISCERVKAFLEMFWANLMDVEENTIGPAM